MEVESSSIESGQEDIHMLMVSPQRRRRKNTRRCICLWVTVVMIIVGLLFLILGLTVFKVKSVVMTVNSVALGDLDFSLDTARQTVLLNFTLDMSISIKNPNMVGFKYTNSTAFLRYSDEDVGEVPIIPGKIGVRDTRSLNITLVLMADRLFSNSTLYSDVISGTVPFQIYMRVAGKVPILFFNIHVVIYCSCDLGIHLASRNLSDSKCHYKTKL
ncbi:hypothetical protein Pfo_004536 [Paulownia fortunei]|nr:hypothetical protein Pfo_004536 [Paulownia fortunei]